MRDGELELQAAGGTHEDHTSHILASPALWAVIM